MKPTPFVAGNWKMYKGGAAGCDLASALVQSIGDLPGVEVVLAPPFTALAAVAHELAGSRIGLAGQNMHSKPEGAFTGEISTAMLLEAGCHWVIIGHSERRQYFGETDASVSEKVIAALAAGLRPIVCVGETLAEREAGKTLDVVFRQLDAFAKSFVSRAGFGCIAYEPVWAIGTGKVAGPEQAEEVHSAVRQRLSEISENVARETRILYGGSVKADNAAGLFGCPNVNGALVGGASLDAVSFTQIVEASLTRV